jgi:hypothetical protein
MTFSEVQKDLIAKGSRAWTDPDYEDIVNQELWQCPNGCEGHRKLKGFKKPGEAPRAFVVCFECREVEEI